MKDLDYKYPIWDCNIYYDADTMVIYNNRICYASGLGIEPEPVDYSKEEIVVNHEYYKRMVVNDK